MNKTVLEIRIEEKANERFEKEFKELIRYVSSHPIGKGLTVSIGDRDIPIANFGCNYGLLNGEGIENEHSNNTNLQVVRKQLLEKYIKEETDEILESLKNIDYLFNQK